MIALDRSVIELPRQLRVRCKRATATIIAEADNLRRQSRLEFDPDVTVRFLGPLRRLSHGKCAYCESLIVPADSMAIDFFRPRSAVAESDRHLGYYWLAYEWKNMLPACAECNATKANNFPLFNERSRAFTPKHDLGKERPLLLDPSEPGFEEEKHFSYDPERGLAVGLSDRAHATIELLGLNRPELCRERLSVCKQVSDHIAASGSHSAMQSQGKHLSALIRNQAPHAAFARCVLRLKAPPELTASLLDPDGASIREKAVAPDKTPTPDDSVLGRSGVRKRLRETSGRTETSGYITRIELINFKAIRKLDLDFRVADQDNVAWRVFLGENGVGKTTVLQAIALALGGTKNLGVAGQNFSDLLNQSQLTQPESTVKVWLSSSNEPVHLRISSSGLSYEGSHQGAEIFLRAYGPTRLLPAPGNVAQASGKKHGKRVIQNLFDPYAPLCDVTPWLAGLTDQNFQRVALTLKDILKLPTRRLILKRNGGNVAAVEAGGKMLPLNLMSRGQQAAVALAVDIMAGIMDARERLNQGKAPRDFRQATGVVLLDEIDAHLHPRWKMEIVPSLRRAFPRIQFLAATHEPLCLRGLKAKEIVVMQRDARKVWAEVCEVSPDGWRVDQILTSEMFGLHSTIDPEIDRKFREYYALLTRSSGKRSRKLQALEAELRPQNRLGDTRREQLIYEAIDDYLANESRLRTTVLRDQMRTKTKRTIAKLWDWAEQSSL